MELPVDLFYLKFPHSDACAHRTPVCGCGSAAVAAAARGQVAGDFSKISVNVENLSNCIFEAYTLSICSNTHCK